MGFFKEIQQMGQRYGAVTAVEERNGLVKSYGELARDIESCAAWYEKQPAERYAVMADSSYQWVCQVFGILCAGKHAILIDSLLPVDNIMTLTKYTETEVLLTDVRDKKVAAAAGEAGIAYEVFAEPEHGMQPSGHAASGDVIVFTSGTSGRSKGVVLSADVIWEKTGLLAKVHATGIEGKMYIPLPLAHLYGMIMAMRAFYEGRTVCLGNRGM